MAQLCTITIYTLTSVYTVFPFQAVSCTPGFRAHRGYCYAIFCSEKFFPGTGYSITVTSVCTVTSQLHGSYLGLHGYLGVTRFEGCVINCKKNCVFEQPCNCEVAV